MDLFDKYVGKCIDYVLEGDVGDDTVGDRLQLALERAHELVPPTVSDLTRSVG